MDDSWRGVVVHPEDDLLAQHEWVFGSTRAARAYALAEAVATSPAWTRMRSRLRIVVRTEPRSLIAVVGDTDPRDQPVLDALGWQVGDSLRRLRPVSYACTESLAESLADSVRDILGPSAVRTARFVALPRGGLFVAGMLAYFLDLEHWQFSTGYGPDGPVIVVDDCMLSGALLRRWLRRQPAGPPVVAAHLHSHPALRHAVEEREPRVSRCIAAADLKDHGRPGSVDYGEWRARWERRTPESYWIGNPDHVCYPWNEPDTLVWNGRRQRVEAGWRVTPPQWCVKNRAAAGVGSSDIQRCVPPEGAVQPADDVLWGRHGDSVMVVSADAGVSLRLTGVAAAMWNAIIQTGAIEQVVDTIVNAYAASRETIRADLYQLVVELRSRALLK